MSKEPIRVIIVGDHPWSGERGHLDPLMIDLGGKPACKVILENGESCFATAENLRKLPTK